jgi:hypothetical protein
MPVRLSDGLVYSRSRARVKAGAAARQGCLDAGFRRSGMQDEKGEVAASGPACSTRSEHVLLATESPSS